MKIILLCVLSFGIWAQALYAKGAYQTCLNNPTIQHERSDELKRLLEADQKEREEMSPVNPKEFIPIAKNDLLRRKRVGEILGEGCFKTPRDYLSAALIYQHGNVPDHYMQAFIWAKKALDLGDPNAKSLMAVALDRYLVSVGKKQLYGTQAFLLSDSPALCYCLQQVELSFPDYRRKKECGRSLKESFEWLASLNANNTNCPNTYCNRDLTEVPKGSIIGFW
ncbi:MAG: Uncharacterized protein K0R24_16 [Gammaproteobacteria bacterium]|nr:Uncharacterized protein [Gammaproteobacteria bacterium]